MKFLLDFWSRNRKSPQQDTSTRSDSSSDSNSEDESEASITHIHELESKLVESGHVEQEDYSPSEESGAMDSDIFSARTEHKYFLRPDRAREFVAGVERHIGAHRFTGPNANTLPRPVHHITTLYFDTETRAIARACEAGSENIKLRARAYYDEHPELAELATSHSDIFRRDPLVWLEVKTRSGPATRKVRFAVKRKEVGDFLSQGVISEQTLASQREIFGESAEAVFDEIGCLLEETEGALRPDCLVHYRRRAWEDEQGELRITLDTRLSYHRAPADMFENRNPLREATSGAPVAVLDAFLVEVKLRLGAPLWLKELMERLELTPARLGPRSFSKFLAASSAIHGVSACADTPTDTE